MRPSQKANRARQRSKPYKKSRKERVDAQALELIAERISLFGAKWREGCAVTIPKWFDERHYDANGDEIIPF